MDLRAPIPTRRAAAALVIVSVAVSLTISRAIAEASERVAVISSQSAIDPFTAKPPARTFATPARTRTPRVLLLGDSVMDQQGGAAAFLLRQLGVDARTVGLWGSGLLTVDQYDYGKTNLSGMWFARARAEIARSHPDLVGVYLNHNYWPPFPHAANGDTITDLWSDAGQSMIRQQARAFITLLREHGARVFFVAPVPSGPNAIWTAYTPVLRAMHVPVVNSAPPLANPDGSRAETKPACDGTEQRVRPQGDLHLTRFGAGRAGTALAASVAARLHVDRHDDAAPGDRTAALVARGDGRGYWLVGCDGSVFHFGTAPSIGGARTAVAGHGGVVAAAGTPNGEGLWIVTADGAIVSVGDAPALRFTDRPSAPVTAATALPGEIGLWATTVGGKVMHAGLAGDFGSRTRGCADRGYRRRSGRSWLSPRRGGRPRRRLRQRAVPRSARRSNPSAPIVGIAAAADGAGYWLTAADGDVIAFGSARFHGAARWQPSSAPWAGVAPTPGPTVGITGRPGSNAGYWVFGTTGRVVARGDAQSYGGDNNLALFTQ